LTQEEMMNRTSLRRTLRLLVPIVTIFSAAIGCEPLNTSSSKNISPHTIPETSLSRDARAALTQLEAETPGASALDSRAVGVLVFPSVVKGGFVFGGFHGEGVLFKGGKLAGYYDTSGATYGLQAGAQQYGYAIYFMRSSALQYLDEMQGWEIGAGPSFVVVDAGLAKSLTSVTLDKDVYAFIFDQKGLMAGIGLQGSKIYRIDR
jgi:lipid-binding SYLF domain-containing protein